MTAAARVIEKFGSAARLAQHLGLHRSTVLRWKMPVEKGGTGGIIPARYFRPILQLAERENIKIAHRELMQLDEAA